MARVRISLDTGPLGEVIGKIKARTSNLLPLMKEFHALAIGAVDDKFRREGPGWPEHAESTKARRGANAAILRPASPSRWLAATRTQSSRSGKTM